jgi:hypothetical protein
MMIGSNELRFNIATIEVIVQHYFDTVLFNDAARVKVAAVTVSNTVREEGLVVRTTTKQDGEL